MNEQFDENTAQTNLSEGQNNPSYGYVYTPYGTEPNGIRTNKTKIFLIVSVTIMVCLLIGCILLGVLLIRNQSKFNEQPYEFDTTESSTDERETSGTFIVIDPTESKETEQSSENSEETLSFVEIPTTYESETISEIIINFEDETSDLVPDSATIYKKSPTHPDNDGDGKADIILDESGNVVTSTDGKDMPVPTVVYKVADSVVEITTETIVRSSRMGQYVTSGAGSGVIISANGFIVTNHHVIEDADTIKVTLTDGTSFNATLIGTDEQSDIALLWINAEGHQLTVATLGASSDLVVGEDIIAIGNPLGSLGGTVTEGIISATARNIEIDGNNMVLLQVSSPINPGNSGGGLFNMAGELIGIVNAKMSETDVEGLGFAIPIDTAYCIINELYTYGYVRGRPTLGVTLVDVTSASTAMYYFRSPYTGVYVYDNETETDLKQGDLILTFDGQEITSVSQITAIITTMKVGDTVEVQVYRNLKEKITVTLVLKEYVPELK